MIWGYVLDRAVDGTSSQNSTLRVKVAHAGKSCSKFGYQRHYFIKCRKTIASGLNDYCTRWCKREHVESNALNNWILKLFLRLLMRVCYFTLITLIFSLPSLNYLFDI